jgi:hypothetical protein
VIIDPESLYLQLGQLIAEMPVLGGTEPLTPDIYRWLGKAAHLVAESGNRVDAIQLTVASDNLKGLLRDGNSHQITAIVYRALATAEANAPAAARGAFIGIGAEFDALKAIGEVLKQANQNVLIVDAYLDEKALTDFAPLAPENVRIRLLSDRASAKMSSLQPAAERWTKQFGTNRPLELRLSAPRALHDRLIVADDGVGVWSLTQSLKDFAGRSPALVQKVDTELAGAKVDFYMQLWNTSTPII